VPKISRGGILCRWPENSYFSLLLTAVADEAWAGMARHKDIGQCLIRHALGLAVLHTAHVTVSVQCTRSTNPPQAAGWPGGEGTQEVRTAENHM